jgi:Methyltransferase small domain
MALTPIDIWRYGAIDVMYRSDLDGGGTTFATSLIDFIRGHFGADKRFGTAFEWCSGPGFIGFAALSENICDALCLADINQDAIKWAQATIEANRLKDKVRCYISDNLLGVDKKERFDLVLANPPCHYAPNSAHPIVQTAGANKLFNLKSVDPGWKTHAGFYSQIGQFLNPGAHILTLETEPYDCDCVSFGHPFDFRPEPPAGVFKAMMRAGGLEHVMDAPIYAFPGAEMRIWVQVSRKPT